MALRIRWSNPLRLPSVVKQLHIVGLLRARYRSAMA
jgi:hypothetical protein